MSSVILKKTDEVEYSDKKISILFIGSAGAGKTCLASRLHSGEFLSQSTATLGIVDYVMGATVNGKDYKVRLLDTAGLERYDSVMSRFYRSVNGAMIVYDVTNYSSYESIKFWMLQVYKHANKQYPVILLGNKSDIDMHAVHHIDGQKVAEDLEMDGFFKTSAKTGEGIDDAMKSLIKLIVSSNQYLSTSQNEHLPNSLQPESRQELKCLPC